MTNRHTRVFGNMLHQHAQGLVTLETVRDSVRRSFDEHEPNMPFGVNIAIDTVAMSLFTSSEAVRSTYCRCSTCFAEGERHPTNYCLLDADDRNVRSIQDLVSNRGINVEHRLCSACDGQISMFTSWTSPPPILYFEYAFRRSTGLRNVRLDPYIRILTEDSVLYEYRIAGVVYYSENGPHFVSRLLINDVWWYHDGMSTGRVMRYEGKLSTASLNAVGHYFATAVVYTRI